MRKISQGSVQQDNRVLVRERCIDHSNSHMKKNTPIIFLTDIQTNNTH